jgi:hypothetical protein
MSFVNELSCDGVIPTGPVSAWPKERHDEMISRSVPKKKMPGVGTMAKGLAQTAGQAVRFGKASAEVREERYRTCKACPLFDPDSKRCTDCGCFMEAKTWVGGDPDMLCPQKKWSR